MGEGAKGCKKAELNTSRLPLILDINSLSIATIKMPLLSRLANFGRNILLEQCGIANPDLPLYQYAPLPGAGFIRLLEIQHGEGDIHCSLQSFDLENLPAYDALSYTWGDPRPALLQAVGPFQYKRQFTIICDGKASIVTANLYYALLQFRRLNRSVPALHGKVIQSRIWIDAICINQRDLAERSAQVAIMDNIYKHASTVFAWLGKDDRYTEPAFRLIHHLSGIPEDEFCRYMYSTSKVEGFGIARADWEAFVAFMNRSWFKRAWVVQEVVLASDLLILCGHLQLTWETMRRCGIFIMETGTWRHLGGFNDQFVSMEDRIADTTSRTAAIGNPAMIDKLKRDMGGDVDLFNLMLGRRWYATDSRDYVFAFLGLMKEARRRACRGFENGLPVPDYTKSVEKVFTECAAFFLRETGNLFLLSTVEDRSFRSPGLVDTLPSWVPDLTVLIQPSPLVLESPKHDPMWNPATTGEGETSVFLPIDHALYLRGAFFGTIVDVAPELDLQDDFNWADILEFTRPLWHVTVSGTTLGDALWRTMIADIEWPSGKHPASSHVGHAFAEMLASDLNRFRRSPFPLGNESPPESKTLRGIWDQVREDPNALWTGTPDVLRAAADQHAVLLQTKKEYMRNQMATIKDAGDIVTRTYSLLMEISSIDDVVFPTPDKFREIGLVDYKTNSPEWMTMQSRVSAFKEQMHRIMVRRRLLRTGENYLGACSLSVRQGDQVWIFPTQKVPFILRDAGDGQYNLVGEAYIHGIMYGECTDQLQFKDISII